MTNDLERLAKELRSIGSFGLSYHFIFINIAKHVSILILKARLEELTMSSWSQNHKYHPEMKKARVNELTDQLAGLEKL